MKRAIQIKTFSSKMFSWVPDEEINQWLDDNKDKIEFVDIKRELQVEYRKESNETIPYVYVTIIYKKQL